MKRWFVLSTLAVLTLTGCAYDAYYYGGAYGPTQGRIYRSGQNTYHNLNSGGENRSNIYTHHQTLAPETFQQTQYWDQSRKDWYQIGMQQQQMDHYQAMDWARQRQYDLDSTVRRVDQMVYTGERIAWTVERLRRHRHWGW